MRFGSIAQYRCPEPRADDESPAPNDVLHGAFRFIAPAIEREMQADEQLEERLANLLPPGTEPAAASGALALAYAMAHWPNRLLFSTNQPHRLASTLHEVRHIIGSTAWQPAMQTLQAAFTRTGVPCAP